MATKFRKIKVN